MKVFFVSIITAVCASLIWALCALYPPYAKKDSWYTDDGQDFDNYTDKINGPRVLAVQRSELGKAVDLLTQSAFIPISHPEAEKLVGHPIDFKAVVQEEQNGAKEFLNSEYGEHDQSSMSERKEMWRKSKNLAEKKLQAFLVRAVRLGDDEVNIGIYFNGSDLTITSHCYGFGKFEMHKMPVIVLLEKPPKKVRMWVWNIVG